MAYVAVDTTVLEAAAERNASLPPGNPQAPSNTKSASASLSITASVADKEAHRAMGEKGTPGFGFAIME